MTARARNALRRPVFIGAVSIVTFIASLVALVVVPQQARRAAVQMRPATEQRPDTEPTVAALREADRQVTAADSAIVAARSEISRLIAATASGGGGDTLSTGAPMSGAARAVRDS
ncbi:MAG TPA: hypothetical protein VFS59_05400, partial [Gemmatimonadaceae bacterium]|nr:hypothetical protein [Gemmatimonadaceae bacterium]